MNNLMSWGLDIWASWCLANKRLLAQSQWPVFWWPSSLTHSQTAVMGSWYTVGGVRGFLQSRQASRIGRGERRKVTENSSDLEPLMAWCSCWISLSQQPAQCCWTTTSLDSSHCFRLGKQRNSAGLSIVLTDFYQEKLGIHEAVRHPGHV